MSSIRALAMIVVTIVAGMRGPVVAQSENDPHYKPVKVVGERQFAVTSSEGHGVVRYFGTGSLERSSSAVRALIDIHGALRNADVYEKVGEEALAAAGPAAAETLLVTPQFLAQVDVVGHNLPSETLRWDVANWLDGTPALAPAPVSAFSVLDAIVRRLADRSRFPALREIVLAGHSAGGQLVQRYAVVGRGPDALRGMDVTVRFVVANPSSYLYFDTSRPLADGRFAHMDPTACPGFNRWKYGLERLPPYAVGTTATAENRYTARRVTYLLGQLDTDPKHPVLDTSCPAELQGAYRLERGRAYVRYLAQRHPTGTNQELAEVAGVDHDAGGMFTSACGVDVLFDRPRTDCAVDAKI